MMTFARLNTMLNSIPDTISTIQSIVITATSNRYSRLIPYKIEIMMREMIVRIKLMMKIQRIALSNLLVPEKTGAIQRKATLIIK